MADDGTTDEHEDDKFVSTRPKKVHFAVEEVGPPSRLYVQRNDRLYVRSHNSVASIVIGIRGRLLLPNGTIVPFEQRHTPNTDRTVAFETFVLAEGFLLAVTAFLSSGTVRRGQTFVELGLVRGLGVAADIVQTLTADYVTVAAGIGWPGGLIRSSVEGPGVLRSITGTDPAVNVEIAETVPTNARWKLLSLAVVLVTDANAADRRVHFVLDDAATVYGRFLGSIDIVASGTTLVTLAPGAADAGVTASAVVVPGPSPILLFAAHRVRTITTNLQAGDNYGAPQLLVEEWIED